LRSYGQIKAGYYPTPPRVVAMVKSWLRFPTEPFTALDPCAGEGLALAQLLERTQGVGYAIELDRDRAREARTRLPHVITGDYRAVRASVAAFGLLWLNPPYDAAEGDDGRERKEKVFLRDTLHWLAPGGVLVYIIPQVRLAPDVARILAYRCEGLRAWRFPDEEYADFGQAVVLGRKKKVAGHDESTAEALAAFGVAGESGAVLPPGVREEGYAVPVGSPIETWRGGEIDPEVLKGELAGSPLWARLREIAGGGKARQAGRPPVDLHRGHLALLLAAGEVDGAVGSGESRHVVRGQVRKVVTTTEEYDDEGRVTRTEHESFRVTVKLVGPDGVVRALE
jgi:hypothetical protein